MTSLGGQPYFSGFFKKSGLCGEENLVQSNETVISNWSQTRTKWIILERTELLFSLQ